MAENKVLMNVVALTDIQDLLVYFSKTIYSPNGADQFASEAMQKCIALFRTDYTLLTIKNCMGELSSHYPSQLVILEHEINQNMPGSSHSSSQRITNTIYENVLNDENTLLSYIQKGRRARCRGRFPVPVIIYKGKYICRSATLAGGAEMYTRFTYDYVFNPDYGIDDDEGLKAPKSASDWALFGRVRSSDIKLLKALNVGTIADFMVENKKVKFGVNVTSSEKVDKENRYSDFSLISLPYPGCEFFKDYRDNNYNAEGLVFDWSQAYVDALITIPDDSASIASQLNIDWTEYKTWDLVTITQNYMKLLLKHIQEGKSGLLIHCISGWDRTPLFVSLIRLSLWADGLIHQNLDAQQILYLTIAYDWMLFGHHLPDRLGKGEEIFFFCFNILKKLTGEEFSLQNTGRKKEKERIVIRTDSETLLDSLMLDSDMRGSNISLNSVCSSLSNMSQDTMPMVWNGMHEDLIYATSNGSSNGNSNGNINGNSMMVNEGSSSSRSPTTRRTSPVSVPSTHFRQRNESASSMSIGSWQMITGAGSIRESDTSDSNGLNANKFCFSSDSSSLNNSSHTLIDDDNMFFSNVDVDSHYRKKRLLKVRETFLNCYHKAIGFKFKNDSSLGSMLGNIAEKVGLAQRS
ncbi:myotubularin-related protein 14 isoform X1 [Atheta coriaria]|uniref:myotubularin-related protein 14 isoform X1 n=1 Tax=Dalotia coriaria TaxID=877792 RepID=UPI0031F3F98B